MTHGTTTIPTVGTATGTIAIATKARIDDGTGP